MPTRDERNRRKQMIKNRTSSNEERARWAAEFEREVILRPEYYDIPEGDAARSNEHDQESGAMNERQSAIYKVICTIAKIEDIEKIIHFSEIRYGFINYVAKYSLARDKYFATETSFKTLEAGGFLKNSKLLRGAKSKKNGFTYEHPVPANVIAEFILVSRHDPSAIKNILSWTDKIFILTTDENRRLGKSLVSSMPPDWKIFSSDIFARYVEAGIITNQSKIIEVDVYGSVAR